MGTWCGITQVPRRIANEFAWCSARTLRDGCVGRFASRCHVLCIRRNIDAAANTEIWLVCNGAVRDVVRKRRVVHGVGGLRWVRQGGFLPIIVPFMFVPQQRATEHEQDEQHSADDTASDTAAAAVVAV